MKQCFYAIVSILFFFLMLFLPKETLAGATSGLLLWFQIVLPTLLPFLIFTNLLIQTNSIVYISNLFGPILQRVFSVSCNGSFAVLAGLLCGYPIGAKVTADLVKTNCISLNEGKYLLSFCNQTSPAFISSYIVIQNLKKDFLLLPTFVILYLSTFLCSLLFRKYYRVSDKKLTTCCKEIAHLNFSFDIFDTCMMNAFENITKIGGYIIVFSILFTFGKQLPLTKILPILEITNGIPFILKHSTDFDIAYVLILALTSFGGICSIAQTSAMLVGTKLSALSYTIEKLITTAVTSLLALFYIFIIRQ